MYFPFLVFWVEQLYNYEKQRRMGYIGEDCMWFKLDWGTKFYLKKIGSIMYSKWYQKGLLGNHFSLFMLWYQKGLLEIIFLYSFFFIYVKYNFFVSDFSAFLCFSRCFFHFLYPVLLSLWFSASWEISSL